MTKRSKIISAVSALAALAVAGFLLSPGEEQTAENAASSGAIPGETAAEISRPAITVTAAAKSVLNDKVRASGLIVPLERVQLQPQVEGSGHRQYQCRSR